MFGEIQAISSPIGGQNEKIAGIIAELSHIVNGSNNINPETQISGSEEYGFNIIGGGTFVANVEVHGSLSSQLDNIISSANEKFGSSDITGAGEKSKEVMTLSTVGRGINKVSKEYVNLSNLVQEKIQNIDAIKEMMERGFNKLYELADLDNENSIEKNSIKNIQDKVFKELGRQLSILQSILKVQIKPTQKDLLDLLKKNKDFTTLAETLGVAYGDATASDRLALVFTNMSDVSIMANKVKDALQDLNISLSEYKNIKNSEQLYNELYKVFEKFNKKKLNTDLQKMLEAMNILKNSQGSQDEILKELMNKSSKKNGKNESKSKTHKKSDSESDSDSSSSSSSSSDDSSNKNSDKDIEGGDYGTEIGRKVKTRLTTNLSKRVKSYEKTLKELYRSYMNQVNRSFKELALIIDLLVSKIGSEVTYDEDFKNFMAMFLGFNNDLDNEKIFYSLVGLDNSVAGKELRARFSDNLDKIITASKNMNNKIFKDITSQLLHFKDVNDTMSDTVLNIKKTVELKSGSNDFIWTDKLVEQSFSMNNIKLIKNSIKKLSFYGRVATIKNNLQRMNKEQKLYQEDYDKLLGKSIGLKLTEIKKEYVENVDRLNDKIRGRGRLLEEHNKTNPSGTDKHLPRGLVETIYKLQYEAKEGLYKSLEAIDLYLMYFTENLSAHPEAVMDLNQMLEQTDIIAKWFTQKSVDNIVDLLSSQLSEPRKLDTPTFDDLNIPPLLQNQPLVEKNIRDAFEKTKKCIDSISVLKNILSMFVHLGDKYGNVKLSDKMHISPNMIYKYLVKYIWVSAFTMGYATGGGNKDSLDAQTGDPNKGPYEPERGDFSSFFDVLFTTIILPLDIYKEVEDKILPKFKSELIGEQQSLILNRLKKDIFIIDDRYFVLALKAMVGKIFTVVDTHTLLKTPDSLANIMTNPVRMIIGAGDVDVIQDAVELYIRLPLLVEFYKSIFEDGNLKYKNNVDKDSELEIIAYIPELGTVWSGLIQCIFDESKHIKDGIYSIGNMKDIVREVNKIYNSYKSTSKDKLVYTVVTDLIAEVNRRYGILKKKDIAEFYQIKKKYIKSINDTKFNDNVNFDILDENNEYERAGPSSQYVESSFNKVSDESLVFTDIKLVRDFRNKIYDELFGDYNVIKDLSTKTFHEKIRYYKKQIQTTESTEHKFELIATAIDQSSNINAYNVDVYLLYHELVMSPMNILQNLFSNILYYTDLLNEIRNNKSKLLLISTLFSFFHDNNLFKVKMISNTRCIVDYNNFQTVVETYLENIKYMISKFRNIICKELVINAEALLYTLENKLINIIIKNDSSAEEYDSLSTNTLEYLNIENNKFLSDTTKGIFNVNELYQHILFATNTINIVNNRPSQLLVDVNKYYDSVSRQWVSKQNIKYVDYVIQATPIVDNMSFKNKSILQKFNMLVFTYIEQFYNSSTKKIYTKLIDEFANKSMSAHIFEQGGIPDMFGDGINIFEAGQTSKQLNYPIIDNANVLSMTTIQVLRTLLTRTLNIQLPVKYHLLDTISEVSTVQLEKYRAYLPVFITYFEHLIEECATYKKLLDNPSFRPEDVAAPGNAGIIFPAYNLTDDFNYPINYISKLSNGDGKFDTYKNNFHEILNNIMNGSRSLINDATNVLNEVNYVPQFGNIRENFIKNFYNNNAQLPYLPISLLNPVVNMGSPIINNLLPIHYINTDMNKYIYGTNYILNYKSSDKEEDINNYLWMKEQIKNYNNSALSTNNLDIKKINQFLHINKSLIQYSYLANHVHTNLYFKSDMFGRNEKYHGAMEIAGGDYFATRINSVNELINVVENQLNENKKHTIVDKLLGKECTRDPSLREYNLDRKKARILNVIDLNINPINIHALMREVPLVNIYNYAFTFDNIIKSFIYNVNPDDLYTDKFLSGPLNKNDEQLAKLSCLLQDPYFIDYKSQLAIGKDSTQLFQNALEISYQPSTYDPKKSLYLSKPKLTTNLFTSLNDKFAKSIPNPTLFHNNKFLRNTLFLVNLQRVIRLKVKNAVYRINSNVVSDTNILNMRVTEYPVSDDTEIKTDEFELTDLF